MGVRAGNARRTVATVRTLALTPEMKTHIHRETEISNDLAVCWVTKLSD